MTKYNALVFLTLILLCGAANADTTVYKWEDSTGKIIYSQTPPPSGTPFEVVEQRASAPLPTTASAQSAQKASAESQAANEQEKEEQERLAQSEQIKQENCAQARTNLTSLTSRGQVTIKEGDLYRKLSEEERQKMISDVESQIEEFCT